MRSLVRCLPRLSLALASAALTATLAAAPAATLAARPAAGGPQDEIVAQALGTTLSARELDDVLALRRAASEEGRGNLRHLVETRLLEKLGRENGLVFSDRDLEAWAGEFDRQIKASGDPKGLDGELARKRLTRAEFKRFLALGKVQETLTRRALGLGDDKPVTGEQQKLWIDEELGRRRLELFMPPWKDGVAARAADITVTATELLACLRQRLPAEVLREDCYQALLVKRIEARLPDIAPDVVARAVEDEIRRRRDDARADPQNKGVPLDQLLAAQGIVVERLHEDPAVRIAALTKLWTERNWDAESLKRVYQGERDLFDGLHGPAHEVAMLFLRGAAFKNQFNPRSFDEAQRELAALVPRVRSREELAALARERSEDADTKSSGGELGWVGPLTPKVPREIREEVVRRLARPESEAQGLAGPLRLANGACLLWIGRRRPAPAWEVMAAHVKAELRRRFVEDVLPRTALTTVFEGT